MEYAKDIILNVGYKRLNRVRRKLRFNKFKVKQSKKIISDLYLLIRKGTDYLISIINNNKFISLALSLLLILICADFILINNFLKIFSTLY